LTVATPVAAVVIGASAGGVEALLPLLSMLRASAPPLLLVLHLPRDRGSQLAPIFDAACPNPVHEAIDKEPIVAGRVYVAPPDYHLLVDRGPCIALSVDDPVCYCRPSIDVLFESAALQFGATLLGIVLTGNNEDGAAGLRAIHDAGGRVVVQEPESALGRAMPEAALARVPQAERCSLAAIGRMLQSLSTGAGA
jgi:two-component system, chemotaxis family, protein-glutamate methylesterase/glutaminase